MEREGAPPRRYINPFKPIQSNTENGKVKHGFNQPMKLENP